MGAFKNFVTLLSFAYLSVWALHYISVRTELPYQAPLIRMFFESVLDRMEQFLFNVVVLFPLLYYIYKKSYSTPVQ